MPNAVLEQSFSEETSAESQMWREELIQTLRLQLYTMAERVKELEGDKGSTLRQRGLNAAGGSAAVATLHFPTRAV